ncbi:MAG: hypothetical protein QM673_10840 [Gordonia sp. (in: high G+C Gram-positive bacteria)]
MSAPDPHRNAAPGPGAYRFSYGRFVLFSLGAGVLVLLVSIPIIVLLAHWTPAAGLLGALVAVIAMIAAIGLVARKLLATAEQRIRGTRADPD